MDSTRTSTVRSKPVQGAAKFWPTPRVATRLAKALI
jgi:hypothetical protein